MVTEILSPDYTEEMKATEKKIALAKSEERMCHEEGANK
jgi:hypothetical protein